MASVLWYLGYYSETKPSNLHIDYVKVAAVDTSVYHEFNEVAKTKQTLLVSHWQFVSFPDAR